MQRSNDQRSLFGMLVLSVASRTTASLVWIALSSNVLFGSYNLNFGSEYLRPYNRESTASRLICEVKHVLARIVVRWGTTREVRVL